MPLIRNKKRKAIGQNIAELKEAGKPQDQAVAIALEVSSPQKKKDNPAKGRAKKKEDSVKAILKFLEDEQEMPKKRKEDEDEDLGFLFQEFE